MTDLLCCAGWCESNAFRFVDLHLNLAIGEGGYTNIQERDGEFTFHGCVALHCELDVRVDCIKMAMEIANTHV